MLKDTQYAIQTELLALGFAWRAGGHHLSVGESSCCSADDVVLQPSILLFLFI